MAEHMDAVRARDPVASVPLDRYSDLLNVEDMAEILQVSSRTIYRLIDREELPSVKVGRRIYFPKRQVIDRLNLQTV